jgi:hypothetical protein
MLIGDEPLSKADIQLTGLYAYTFIFLLTAFLISLLDKLKLFLR